MGEGYTDGHKDEKEIKARMIFLMDELEIFTKQRDELLELLNSAMDVPDLDYSRRDEMRA